MRSAQRNLNKILLGNEDDLGSECSSRRTSTVTSSQSSTQSAKTIFELDTLISNVFSGADSYMQSNSNVMESSNAAIAKDMNSSAMRSITQNSQNSSSALKNDVKLSEYSEFAPCYATIQQPIQTVDMHLASMSQQPTHSQSSTNGNGHLSKIFGDDDTSMLMNNNNHKSIQNSDQHTQAQLPTTPQPNRIRNSLISDMVNFSPMNGIMSQDNASGEYFYDFFFYGFSVFVFGFSGQTILHRFNIHSMESLSTTQIHKFMNHEIGKRVGVFLAGALAVIAFKFNHLNYYIRITIASQSEFLLGELQIHQHSIRSQLTLCSFTFIIKFEKKKK